MRRSQETIFNGLQSSTQGPAPGVHPTTFIHELYFSINALLKTQNTWPLFPVETRHDRPQFVPSTPFFLLLSMRSMRTEMVSPGLAFSAKLMNDPPPWESRIFPTRSTESWANLTSMTSNVSRTYSAVRETYTIIFFFNQNANKIRACWHQVGQCTKGWGAWALPQQSVLELVHRFAYPCVS